MDNNTLIIITLVVVAVAVFFFWKDNCKLTCNGKEGYDGNLFAATNRNFGMAGFKSNPPIPSNMETYLQVVPALAMEYGQLGDYISSAKKQCMSNCMNMM
jgi:hypothetical protein